MSANFRELLGIGKADKEPIENHVNEQPETPQLKESLIFECREVPIECEPLKSYFSQLESPPRFLSTMRANKRGYLGKWSVRKNELYLIEICGLLENKEEITLDYLFPGKQIVMAEWFSSEIVLNQGKLLALKNKDRPAIYEKDLHLVFENGQLVNRFVTENEVD